jgi:hypothetical protein
MIAGLVNADERGLISFRTVEDAIHSKRESAIGDVRLKVFWK